MKISTKITVCFLALIILVFSQLAITQIFQNNILNSIRQIEDVEIPLGIVIQKGINYGSIASTQIQISLLRAQNGEYQDIEVYKQTSDAVVMNLEDVFNREAGILLNLSEAPPEVKDSIAAKCKEIGQLNLLMKDMRSKAFAAIDTKDVKTAYSLSVGGDYEKYQKELQSAEKDLTETINKENLDVSNTIHSKSLQITYINLVSSLAGVLFIIVIIFILRSFIAEREEGILNKEKELNIREKMEQKYKIFFENATDAIFVADAETRQLVDCNESAEKLMGYSRAKILSMKADELHPEDKVKETMEGFKKQIEGKIKSVFTEVLTINNNRIPVKVNASLVSIGNKRYLQGIFTELK